MADDNKKKLVEGFDKELELLQDKLNNIASLLGDKMRGKLSDLSTDAGNFVEQFDRGEDITKKLSSKLTTLQKDINKLSLNRLKLENDLARVQQQGNTVAEGRIRNALLQNKITSQQLESYQTVLTKLNQAAEEEKKITEEKKKQNSLTEQAKKLFTDAVKPLAELFTLAGILKAIVEGALRFNKTSVEISKNLGYAGNEADRVAEDMQNIAFTSNNINVTLKSLGQAMGELNAATGGVAEYSADALETQVMLTKQFGLTGEEAAGIYKFSVLTGKSSSQVNKEMVAAFASTRNMVRGSANFQKTMAEAAKVSGQLAANFRNNPAEITKAVVQAQALGTTLEKTKSQGEKLLDFESSIEAELKAELLTGQQMNLERARAAALAGDQVTVMKELANQGMTLEKFQGMNVLAQKSFAEALGLSADELSNQLNQQKIAKEQGKSLAQVQAEELEKAQKRQNVQDRFNALVEKLMDMIGKIGILLNPFFRVFEFITDNAYVLYTVLGLIALNRLPAIAKFFKSMGSDIKDMAKNAKNLFSGDKSQFAGGGFSKGKELLAKKQAATPEVPETGKAGKGMGGLVDSLKGIKTTDMIKGAAAILILSAALFVAAKAFQEFADVEWEAVALGVGGIAALAGIAFLLGKSEKDMMKGAVAVLVLGAALIPFAYAMSLIADLDIKNVLAAAAGLVIFGAAVFGLGALMMGPGAFLFGAGILAMIALGGALIVLGVGLQAVSEGGKGVTELFKQLSELDVKKLDAVAPALETIGSAILKLGAGTVLTAIGGLIGGEGPVGIIRKISESGAGLQIAATGLQGVATALTQVSAALAAIDTSKLEALSDFSVKMSVGSAVKGITDFITAPIKAIEGAIGGGGEAADNAPMIAAINEVRDAVNKLYTKNNDTYIDSVKVTTESQKRGNYRVA